MLTLFMFTPVSRDTNSNINIQIIFKYLLTYLSIYIKYAYILSSLKR